MEGQELYAPVDSRFETSKECSLHHQASIVVAGRHTSQDNTPKSHADSDMFRWGESLHQSIVDRSSKHVASVVDATNPGVLGRSDASLCLKAHDTSIGEPRTNQLFESQDGSC